MSQSATVLPIGNIAFKQKREIESLLKRIDAQAAEIVGLQQRDVETGSQARDHQQQLEELAYRARRDSDRAYELETELAAAQARIAELEAGVTA